MEIISAGALTRRYGLKGFTVLYANGALKPLPREKGKQRTYEFKSLPTHEEYKVLYNKHYTVT